MANKKYEETDVQAIAEAIREKTGSEELYKVSDMASGVDEVYEAGKKSEYDEFWDNANLDNVSSISFSGNLWNDESFKPPRDIIWGNNSAQWSFARNKITNIKECLERQGVKLDLSKATSFGYMFSESPTKELPEISMAGVSKHSLITPSLSSMPNLVSVDKLVFPSVYSDTAASYNILHNAKKLQHLIIEGLLDVSWNLSASPLTVESLKSIITHLKDYSGTTSEYTYTVTFKSTAFEALEAEGATAEYNGVACTWAELLDNLKWNIVKA